MFNFKETPRRALLARLAVAVVLGLAIALTACAPQLRPATQPAAPIQTGDVSQEEQVPAEAEQVVVQTVQITPGGTLEITQEVMVTQQVTEQVTEVPSPPMELMLAATPEELKIWQSQIDLFNEQTGSMARLESVPFEDFNRVLLESIEAGTPPDVAVLSYNHVALLGGNLQPLDELIMEFRHDIQDFLPDAVDSNTFFEQIYAFPWLRSACLPRYRNLGLFRASQNPARAFQLMDFLTRPGQQIQNLDGLQWYPIRQSIYEERGIECPRRQALRPGLEEVSTMISLVEERWPALEPVLEGNIINPYEAATEVVQGTTRVTVAPVMRGPHTEAEFVDTARSGEVVLGVLFLEDGLPYPPAGDYAVKCRFALKGKIPCDLVKPDGQRLAIDFELMFQEASVGQPFCLALADSSVCFCLDGRCYCLW